MSRRRTTSRRPSSATRQNEPPLGAVRRSPFINPPDRGGVRCASNGRLSRRPGARCRPLPVVGHSGCGPLGTTVQQSSAGSEYTTLFTLALLRPPCQADCNGDGQVTIDELILAVGIGLDAKPLTACPAADSDASGMVRIDELVNAVRSLQVILSPGTPPAVGKSASQTTRFGRRPFRHSAPSSTACPSRGPGRSRPATRPSLCGRATCSGSPGRRAKW
jgi:hypothetical protein